MGLDWHVNGRKAKPGFEDQFAQLWARGIDDDRIEPFSITCYEEIGAPRIGIDEEATAWYRTHVYEPNLAHARDGNCAPGFSEHWLRPYAEILEDLHGKWVPELARDRPGYATASGGLYFRGKHLHFFYKILGNALISEASRERTAEECLDYASRLEAAIEGHDDVEHITIVRNAITWLRFWGERGFGYTTSQ